LSMQAARYGIPFNTGVTMLISGFGVLMGSRTDDILAVAIDGLSGRALRVRQWPQLAGGDVLVHFCGREHSRNHRRDGRIGQAEAQRELGATLTLETANRLEVGRCLAPSRELSPRPAVPVITRAECSLRVDAPRQEAVAQGRAGDQGRSVMCADMQEAV